MEKRGEEGKEGGGGDAEGGFGGDSVRPCISRRIRRLGVCFRRTC